MNFTCTILLWILMCSWNWVRVVLNETPQIAQGKVQMFCLQEAFWRAICYLSVYNSPWVQSSLWENLGSASRAINGMLTTDWLYIPCVWCRPAPSLLYPSHLLIGQSKPWTWCPLLSSSPCTPWTDNSTSLTQCYQREATHSTAK